jgi:hypothetical protein
LVRNLPPEAAVWRDVDPDAAPWDLTRQLLASLVELTHAGQLLFLQANSKKGTKIPKPLVIPRPGVEEPKRQTVTPAQFASMFGPPRGR